MKGNRGIKTKLFVVSAGLLFLLCASVPLPAFAADEVQMLKEQLKVMSDQMKAIQDKLDSLEKTNVDKEEQISEIDQRLNKAELHTATDKVSFGIEMRTRADSLHYDSIHVAPSSLLNGFFNPWAGFPPAPPGTSLGFNGATTAQIQGAMGAMAAAGMVPKPEQYDVNNDVAYTTKFRLNMKAKVNPNLDFAGRLAAYKVWGDSTGVKFNQGSLGDVTFDGNTSSLPHGDTLRLERAYFNYKNYIGSIPINFSLGRRPSTEGPPLEYGLNSLEAGSPLGTIINWQFDGASFNIGLEDATGIPGAALKFCYGVGFEGDWGNSYSLANTGSDVEDVHMFGFIATLFDNDETSAVLNYAHAWDVTDGFTGLTVMPFIVSYDNATDTYSFAPNNGGFVSRMQPSTNIGDWDAASLLLRSNFSRYFGDIDVFLATSWSHTDPSQISKNPFYQLMGQGLLSSNGTLEQHDGYSIYVGALFPMPYDARLGLEYNWGSKYWFNFTGAEDSLIGSKLAVRGQVYEAYYIQPIYKDNFFLKLGTQFYDYEYTGSGNPLGEPVKIDEATAFDALNAVVDKVWNVYLSATLRY